MLFRKPLKVFILAGSLAGNLFFSNGCSIAGKFQREAIYSGPLPKDELDGYLSSLGDEAADLSDKGDKETAKKLYERVFFVHLKLKNYREALKTTEDMENKWVELLKTAFLKDCESKLSYLSKEDAKFADSILKGYRNLFDDESRKKLYDIAINTYVRLGLPEDAFIIAEREEDREKLKELMEPTARFLEEAGEWRKAAKIFEKLGDKKRALKAYISQGNEVFWVHKEELALELACEAIREGNKKEAAGYYEWAGDSAEENKYYLEAFSLSRDLWFDSADTEAFLIMVRNYQKANLFNKKKKGLQLDARDCINFLIEEGSFESAIELAELFGEKKLKRLGIFAWEQGFEKERAAQPRNKPIQKK